jgi:hypothetical protein
VDQAADHIPGRIFMLRHIRWIAVATAAAAATAAKCQYRTARRVPIAVAAGDSITTGRFWEIVQASRTDECGDQARALRINLEQLEPEQIVRFDQRLMERMIESYRWELWGVAYLINGGASDDGFDYFRGWLIGRGREYFTAALREPERAAERAEPGDAECEDMLYAAAEAYRAKTGRDLPPSALRYPAQPAGKPWTEEELPARFPIVARRFGG